MTAVTLTHIDGETGEKRSVDFALEPSLPQGEIPERVLQELVRARTVAKDYAQSFSDAVKAQAEKHGVNAAALKRYIVARESADDLAKLIGA